MLGSEEFLSEQEREVSAHIDITFQEQTTKNK